MIVEGLILKPGAPCLACPPNTCLTNTCLLNACRQAFAQQAGTPGVGKTNPDINSQRPTLNVEGLILKPGALLRASIKPTPTSTPGVDQTNPDITSGRCSNTIHPSIIPFHLLPSVWKTRHS